MFSLEEQRKHLCVYSSRRFASYLPPSPSASSPHDCTPSRAPSHPLSRARVVSYPLPGHSFSLSLFLHLPSPLSLLPAGRRFPSGIRVLAPRSLPISLPSQRRAITPSSLKRLTRVPRRRFRCYSERDRLFSVISPILLTSMYDRVRLA